MRRRSLVLAVLLLLAGLALATTAYAKEIEGTGTAFLGGRGVYIIDGHPGRWTQRASAWSWAAQKGSHNPSAMQGGSAPGALPPC